MPELIEDAFWSGVCASPLDGPFPPSRDACRSEPLEGPVDLVDPLAEGELDVLRFLPSRLTCAEIAYELYISQNTLKFHLKVIYRKLGVGSGAEASAVPRRMTVAR